MSIVSRSKSTRPNRARRRGDQLTIRFAISDSSLGAILVAATDVGVCAILLDDDISAMTADLKRRFAGAEFMDGGDELASWVAAVVSFVNGTQPSLDLPLDLRGTPFQQRVWQALLKVPHGATTTYAELARRLGVPNSVRAVGGAIAANPLAVVVPCHRVIRSDGSLCGYRWGVERKIELRRREQMPSAT